MNKHYGTIFFLGLGVLILFLTPASYSRAEDPVKSLVESLARDAAQKIDETSIIRKELSFRLSPDMPEEVRSALTYALTSLAHPFQISGDARVTLKAMLTEGKEHFWERPYKQVKLQVLALENNQEIWSTTVRSQRELIASFWSIPIRIVLILIIWPVFVSYGYNFFDMGRKSKKYFMLAWGVTALVIAWTYVGPTFF
jgi:hypothetical protein